MKQRFPSIVAVLGLCALCSGCLLAAAGAIEMDRQNHKAPPPPSTATPDAGTAPAPPAAPKSNGTTSL